MPLNSLSDLHQWRWVRNIAIGAGTSFRPMKFLCLSTHILAERVTAAKITRRRTCRLPARRVEPSRPVTREDCCA